MRAIRQTKWREALPRIIADMILVHLAAVSSLAAVVVWQAADAGSSATAALIRGFETYYLRVFCPLSVTFPVVFWLSGFYHKSRAYAPRHKWIALAKGASLATLVYFFANFLLSRADDLPRSASIAFAILVNALTIGARVLKNWMTAEHSASAHATPQSSPAPPVLVVGGGGYIGSILCRRLLSQGRRVRLLDNFVYGNEAVRDLFGRPGFELHIGDCRNIQSVVSAVSGCDSIIHLAAVVGDPACEQDRAAALEINYAATRMLIEIAKGHGVRRLIFASSCSVYGETEEFCDEKTRVGPISLYAQTKVDSEEALLQAQSERFSPTILRLATVFGNSYRPRFDLVVNLLTAKAIRDGVITIYNGEQWRPFIHVSDVAEAFLAVLGAPVEMVAGEIFNAGDSRLNYTLHDVARTIQEVIPGTRVEHVENPDRRNYRVCFDKIRKEVGFECKVDLRQGIEDLKDALESRAIPDYTDPAYNNQRFLKAMGLLASKEEIDAQVMAAFALALSNQQPAAREVRARSA